MERISKAHNFQDNFDLESRLNVAVSDFHAHRELSEKRRYAVVARKQSALLRTLLRRLDRGSRNGRVLETLGKLGVRGAITLALNGWNGVPFDRSLVCAAERELARTKAGELGRSPSASNLWWLHLTCIYAQGSSQSLSIGRRVTDSYAHGSLADFIRECSEAASIKLYGVPYSSLYRITRSKFVQHFLSKRAHPF